ncbi:MAG: hypothetical protein GY861_12550 [bacterium]|nr:hypothetical protein [bacterium]
MGSYDDTRIIDNNSTNYRGGAPFVSRMPRNEVKSSDFELIRKIRQEYSNAWEANRWEFYSMVNAWRMCFGAENEQWEAETRQWKLEQEQRIAQYNMIKQKIATFTGMIIADEYDFAFNPVNGVKTTGIEAMENAYYCDKEICNYDYHYGLMIEDGVIHLGIMEVQVTNEFDPLGSICFKRALPMRWVIDPYWKTDDDRDCMKAWKQGHMTIQQMENTFPKLPSSPRLEAEKLREEKLGMDFTEPDLYEYDYPFPRFKNAYHIIEAHWVEEIHKKRIIARNSNGDWIPFPVTNDNEELAMFAQMNGVENFQEGQAKIVPYTDKIHYSATISPELWPYDLLENGKPEVQIKGLPIIQFTTNRDIAGRNQGKVQALIDPQKDLNYAQSKKWELLANQLGGGLVYNKSALPDETTQEDFEKNHNDPSESWGVDGDPKNFATHLTDAQISPELTRQVEQTFEFMDRIPGVSAAASGETQGASEPASLYAMKLKVNKIGTLTIDRRVKHVRERMAEAYFNQAQVSYAGNERRFTSKDGKKMAILNEELPGGMVKNQVEDMPRISISITESENNLSKQLRDRADIASILESMPPEFTEAMAISYTELFKTTSISEEKKAQITEALTLEIVKARMASIAQITNTEASAKQGELMSLQIGAQIEKVVAMLSQTQQQPNEMQDMISQQPQPLPQQEAPANPEFAQQAEPAMEEQAFNIQEPLQL